MEVPSATAANATALIVCDFEAGTNMSPLSLDAADLIFTVSQVIVQNREDNT
jgi:hypothetical protein